MCVITSYALITIAKEIKINSYKNKFIKWYSKKVWSADHILFFCPAADSAFKIFWEERVSSSNPDSFVPRSIETG